ncbi:helix-turn-helix transcriptional regulator [Niabella pedocola]|uniref:Helix-turn-helix transcriptional regulator n=1 Tax=Niabella pedocola TaxID=1752077 RepID=A0ABS8PTJ7_9BACT|nr:helix-turn-helix transcriptional regulator [Niabella pedocola]MCD2424398.1 helix-turn-helix transcriptional regulator [Niabella pedocola]
MLIPGTEMHLITFGFICIELVMLSYLCLYRLARKDDKTVTLDLWLCFFLIIYNISGGLLPDPKLPGSFFVQECIAYATGFITPCYFPYYVLKCFNLKKMRFHAYAGVFIFLVSSYVTFVITLSISGNLDAANNVLIVPILYSIWVLVSVYKAVRYKYREAFSTRDAKEELIVLMLCLSPWLCLPVITYFNHGQPVEAITTNTGFLLLLALHIKQTINRLRIEYDRLVVSESKLKEWNIVLQQEVEKRTREIERLNREEKFRLNCAQYQLTNREKEIAFLVFIGESYKNVADKLFIAERTVAKHVQNIFYKIRVSNRVELCQKLTQ